jgi:hypothetical protein
MSGALNPKIMQLSFKSSTNIHSLGTDDSTINPGSGVARFFCAWGE